VTDWRRASAADAVALRDLERAANLVGLAHVFPAEEFPFPDEAVLDRWRDTLAEPDVVVEVVDGPGRLQAFAAHDPTTLRHLAVHPDDWGRGLARAGVDRAVAAMAASGGTEAWLWCLAANARALGLYRRLGWRPTGESQAASWPPYPVELRLSRPTVGHSEEGLWRSGPG
jgi:ribosomal protein S18 acetylase RimI-like enzyme